MTESTFNKIRKVIRVTLDLCGIASIVTVLWQCLEILTIGEVVTNYIDTIIGFILTLSLYYNYIFYFCYYED